MIEQKIAALNALKQLEIEFELIEHEDAKTMEQLQEVDKNAGAFHCKNLFLCNRQQTDFYLLLLKGEKAFRTASVSKQIGASRLSFATPELLKDKLGLLPGAISPLGLINDTMHQVTVLVDKDLDQEEKILVHPNVSTASVLLQKKDLQRFLDHCGNPQVRVTIE